MAVTIQRIAKVRSVLQERFHRTRIHDFVASYDRSKPSMVILPGGLGSRLHRTPLPLTQDPDPEADELKAAWVGLDTLLGGALKLTMESHSSGRYVDGGLATPYVVLPNGPVDELKVGPVRISLGGLTPYTTAIERLRDEFNIAVFGFDWRRRTSDSAGHLESFLRTLEQRVELVHNKRNVLRETTLVGHSQGGLVGAAFMWKTQMRDHPQKRWCKRFVSIGAPFYGTLNHHARYYLGEDMLKLIYERKQMAALIASMPGLFGLIYPAKALYERHFVAMQNPELTMYPLQDSQNKPVYIDSKRAFDEFWPEYIPKRLIASAERDRASYCHPLPHPVRKRVYHIRQGGNTKASVYLQWEPWRRDFDPDEHDFDLLKPHAQDELLRRSDGTTPYWSARLPGTPMENVLDYANEKVGHRDLMSHPETTRSLIHLEKNGVWPTNKATRRHWGSDWRRTALYGKQKLGDAVAVIREAGRQLGNASDLEARLLDHADAGALLRDAKLWATLDERTTP